MMHFLGGSLMCWCIDVLEIWCIRACVSWWIGLFVYGCMLVLIYWAYSCVVGFVVLLSELIRGLVDPVMIGVGACVSWCLSVSVDLCIGRLVAWCICDLLD